jgi:glutamate-1-semialdehyde aminotransferase
MLWASTVSCLILIVSFAVFAVNKTNTASAHQAGQVAGAPSAPLAAGQPAATLPAAAKKSAGHRILDEAAETLRSPFATVTSSSHSEWTIQLVGTLLALFVYGVLVRFIARSLGLGIRTI